MSTYQPAKARLDAIEAQLKEVNTVLTALLHAQVRNAAGDHDVAGYTAATVGAWIEGEIPDMTGQAVAGGEAEAEVAGHMMGYDSQHYPHCSTQFFCPSRQCV